MEIDASDFGSISIDDTTYDHDVVIDGGRIRERQNSASKSFRGEFGHTPLSARENIPWGGKKLIVGTGYNGSLPVMREVYDEAERRGIELVAVPTPEACRLLRKMEDREIYAVLHTTC